MLKFGRVGPNKKSVKLDGVGPKDISFRKFNLNFFYKKMDSGFWTWSKYLDLDLNLFSKYLDIDFKKIQSYFGEKMDLEKNVDWIIKKDIV